MPESEFEARRRRKTRFEPASAAEVKALKYDTVPATAAGAGRAAPQRRRPQFEAAPVSHSWAAGARAWAAEAQTPRYELNSATECANSQHEPRGHP